MKKRNLQFIFASTFNCSFYSKVHILVRSNLLKLSVYLHNLLDNGLLKLNITNKFNFIQMKMNVSKFKVFKLNFISEWVFTQLNKTFPWAIFVPQINSLSVSVRGELGLSGQGAGNQSDVLLRLWARNELKWEIIDMKDTQFPHKFILLDTLGKI